MPLSRAFQKLVERGLLTTLALRSPPQPVPPQFRMDLHCAYHQGPGHDTDHCFDGLPSPIVLDDSYEIVGDVDVHVHVITRSGRIVRATPPITRPFGGTDSSEEAGAIPFSFHQKVNFIHDGEFVTTIDHDTHFGLGFTPSKDDVHYMARLCRDRVRAQLFGIPFDYLIRPYTFNLADYFVRGSEIQPCIEEIVSMTIAPPSPDQVNLFSLCFLDETTIMGYVDSMDPPLSFDFLSRFVTRFDYVSDDSVMDLSIYEYSFVSYEDVLLLAPYSPTSQILDIDDEIAQHDLDEKATLTVGDVEIVDFSTANQPRELKIGSPLSTEERDSLIHLLRSYLDVFEWPRSSGHLASSKRSSGGFFIKESGENAFSHEPLAISHDGAKWKVHQLHFHLSGAFRMTVRKFLFTHLISRLDLLRYLFNRLTLDASLPKIKSRSVDDDFPKEEFVAMTRLSGWRMYFDGATNHSGYGIGVLLPYHAYLELLIENFEELKYIHLPRAHIQFADTLATLAYIVDIPTNIAPAYCYLIDETEVRDDLPWFHGIHRFGSAHTTRCDNQGSRALRQLTTRFMILWGIDIIGKISLKSSNGLEFILVAIYYFTKWVEAASYVKLTFSRVANFIRSYTLLLGVRHEVADHIQAYQRKMARAFKKRVRPRPLQKGDLVLRILRGLIGDPRGKFRPSWSGPYVIRELTLEGAAWLTDLDGNQFLEQTNVD
ncbi:hypothetical protein AAG906_017190 [Vitis piasezkii]